MDAFMDWLSNFDGCGFAVNGVRQPKKDRTKDYHIHIMMQKLRNGETFSVTFTIMDLIDNMSCDLYDVQVTMSKDANGRVQVKGSDNDRDFCEELMEVLNSAM